MSTEASPSADAPDGGADTLTQRRIVVILPTVLHNDAVGNATMSLIEDLSKVEGAVVTLIARNSDRPDAPYVMVTSVGDLLLTREFLEADLIIYVFAIYSDLFDAMLIGNGRAAQVVRFHNVTPKAFVPAKDHGIIERSVRQIQNFQVVDEIWADSQENADELMRQGVEPGRIRNMPLTVDPFAVGRLTGKPADVIRLLYVGRFVPSKGLEDLIEACALMKAQSRVPFQARLMGSTRHSPKAYLDRLADLIARHDLQDTVLMDGPVTQATLSHAYVAAHIVTTASRHEGFCVPIIEGLAAGCVPVTYSNSNLKHISDGLGRLAEQDKPDALAEALIAVAEALHRRSPLLELQSGQVRVREFDAAAAAYVSFFGKELCADRTIAAVDRLLGASVVDTHRPDV